VSPFSVLRFQALSCACFVQKIVKLSPPETSANIYHSTRHNIIEDENHQQRCDKLNIS